MDETPEQTIERLAAEVNRLRDAFEYEARVCEAHFEGYKTYPKSRRRYAEEQVDRMRVVAQGDWPLEYHEKPLAMRQSHLARVSRVSP